MAERISEISPTVFSKGLVEAPGSATSSPPCLPLGHLLFNFRHGWLVLGQIIFLKNFLDGAGDEVDAARQPEE